VSTDTSLRTVLFLKLPLAGRTPSSSLSTPSLGCDTGGSCQLCGSGSYSRRIDPQFLPPLVLSSPYFIPSRCLPLEPHPPPQVSCLRLRRVLVGFGDARWRSIWILKPSSPIALDRPGCGLITCGRPQALCLWPSPLFFLLMFSPFHTS